jgi:hypothetical protein
MEKESWICSRSSFRRGDCEASMRLDTPYHSFQSANWEIQEYTTKSTLTKQVKIELPQYATMEESHVLRQLTDHYFLENSLIQSKL